MKTKMPLYFAVSILLLSTPSSGQDKEESSKFKKELDSIIEDAFERFDEKLGTYIFRDEPGEFDAPDDGGESLSVNHEIRRPSGRSFPRGVYSVPPEHGIVRNISPSMPWETIDENLLFRYNRVEGLFLGLNYPQKYYWNAHRMSLFASGGYGFKSHRWRGGLGTSQQFGTSETLIEIGVEGHSLTDSRDEWIVDLDENNLSALLFRYDYRDYFAREGISVWTGVYKRWEKSDLQLQIAFRNDTYESLEKLTNWSVFGTGRIFRDNLPVADGRMQSILSTIHFHSTETRKIMTGGWSVTGSAELAGDAFGGIFDFNSYTLDLRRYQPISRYNNLNIRLRGSSATGEMPPQKQFELGGLGTLPAYRFKEFSGNRLILVNAEYLVNGKMFDEVEFFPSWLLRNVNLILFADAGYLTSVSGNSGAFDGFEALSKKTLLSDWGVGVGTRDAKLRLGFAWRTDEAGPPMVFLRINRPF